MNFLTALIAEKHKEIAVLEKDPRLIQILKQEREPSRAFSHALCQRSFTLIAEVKRRSPALGDIAAISNPVELALSYCQGGAAAISVLTDAKGFGGSMHDLDIVCDGIRNASLNQPVMRKDFILHPLQLAEAVRAGAHAVLLIASVLEAQLKPMLQECKRLGLEALVEVHDLQQLDLSLESGATIIGVNRRNLKTFTIDQTIAEKLRREIPKEIIAVAESGIHSAEDALQMQELGYQAILVGEALVKAKDPAVMIQSLGGRRCCK